MISRMPLLFALVISAASGFLYNGSFPALHVWPLALVALFGLGISLIGRSFWTGTLVGLVFGLTFWLSLIHWLTLYLGPVPWLALGILQALFVALSGGVLAIVLNKGNNLFASPWWKIPGVAVIASAVWTLRETITSVFPYGGFSWGRLAQSQSESPYSQLVAWTGIAGLSFLVAMIAFLTLQVVRQPSRTLFLVPILFAVVLIAIPAFPVTITGEMKVLAVQGNSRAGLFDNAPPGEVLGDHVAGTLPYQGQDIDVVVWPENAADIDPLRSEQSAQILTELSRRLDAPIVTGTITKTSEDEYYNSSIVWTDSWQAQYDKIRPVPFAEYMPDRAFWRFFQPDLVDLVSRDYSFGTRPNVIEIADVPVGISICFDITDDTQIYQMMDGGAEVIFAQTNNADFGKTSENLQQLEIARLRAIETARSVVNISTVGTSQIISPTGETIESIPAFEPGELLSSVPLSTTVTPAMMVGRIPEFLIAGVAVVGVFFILLRRNI
jgi:apolipoprotein N-acyltransferase